MPAPFAVPGDVAAIWRPLTVAEEAVVDARIAQASRLVRLEIPTIDTRIAEGSITRADVTDVVAEMVWRRMVLPAYARQHSVAVDDASESSTIDGEAAREGLYLTENEKARLTGGGSSDPVSFDIAPAD